MIVKKFFKTDNLPYFTLGAASLGVLLRILLFTTGIDSKGLFRANHPANIMLYALSMIVLVGVFLWAFPLKRTPVYKKMFPPSKLAFIGSIVGSIGILATDFLELLEKTDGVTIVSFILGFLAVGSLLYAGYCRLLGIHPGFLFRGLVSAYFVLHLVSQYRFWSAEPQFQNYLFQMLASIFLMFNAYHRSTLDAGIGQRRWYVMSNQMALFFSCLSIVGESTFFYLCMSFWTFTEMCSLKKVRRIKAKSVGMYLPPAVRYCIGTLEAAGYEAYVVGGCVRDALLDIKPQDYDLCTNAKPEMIADLFSDHRLIRSGEKHGTIGVVIDKVVYEITTFRTEGGYADSRHPDWVCFVSDIKEDLARRDFTINAIAYSPKVGFVDPFKGRNDLQDKILRAVGDPSTRFSEDPLRILRGMRFAVRFGMKIDQKTQLAMFNLATLMDSLARERVYDELCKILPLVSYQDILQYAPILTQVIPELSACIGFDQHSPHHAYDVYTHIAHVTGSAIDELPLRWAALLHDIGKPDTFTQDEDGRGHFHSHAQIGAEKAEKILLRLKAPTAMRECVVFLVLHHMIPLEPNKKLLRRRLGRYGTKNCNLLLHLQRADFCSKGGNVDTMYFDQIEDILKEIEQENSCLTTRDLAINGNDLIDLGFEPGPIIGKVLTTLLGCVQDEILTNTKEELLEAAKGLKE